MEARNLYKMLISTYDNLVPTRYRAGKKFIIIRVTTNALRQVFYNMQFCFNRYQIKNRLQLN